MEFTTKQVVFFCIVLFSVVLLFYIPSVNYSIWSATTAKILQPKLRLSSRVIEHRLVAIKGNQTSVQQQSVVKKKWKSKNINPNKKRKKFVKQKNNLIKTVPVSQNQKYLIYLCDETRRCGGLGDRQRGIISTFVMSLALNRKFGIIMTSPCDIKLFYKPGEIDWVIDEEELVNKSSITVTTNSKNVHLLPQLLQAKQHLQTDVVYVMTNYFSFESLAVKYANVMPKYLNISKMKRKDIFRNIWQRMMIPTDRLRTQLENITKSAFVNGYRRGKQNGLKTELVCAHIRIGKSKYLPYDHKELDINSVHKIWEFIDLFKTSRVFIATDHADVRKTATTRYGSRYIGSYAPFVNPDTMRTHEMALRGFEQTLIDQIMLYNCDVLITCHSGFSLHAGYMKQKQDNLFYFDGKTVTGSFKIFS